MNKIILVGNLCREPETETVGKGKNKISRLWNTLAINNGKDKETTFVPFTLLGKSAEIVEEYCDKGSKLLVEGHLEVYMNSDNKSILSVSGDRIELLGSKGE